MPRTCSIAVGAVEGFSVLLVSCPRAPGAPGFVAASSWWTVGILSVRRATSCAEHALPRCVFRATSSLLGLSSASVGSFPLGTLRMRLLWLRLCLTKPAACGATARGVLALPHPQWKVPAPAPVFHTGFSLGVTQVRLLCLRGLSLAPSLCWNPPNEELGGPLSESDVVLACSLAVEAVDGLSVLIVSYSGGNGWTVCGTASLSHSDMMQSF